MASADDVQRLFLQAIVSRRVVTKALARVLLKKCVEAVKGPPSPSSRASGISSPAAANEDLDVQIPDNDDSLNTFVINLNVSLDKLDLDIVPFVDGFTGNQVYILVRPRSHPSFLYRGTDTSRPGKPEGRWDRASGLGLFTCRAGLFQSSRASPPFSLS